MQVSDVMAGDLEQPGQLEKLAAARAHGKEIILIASNAAGAKLAFNLLLSLEAQGLSNYVWLTDDPTYCHALFYGPLRVACAWSSYLSVRFCASCSLSCHLCSHHHRFPEDLVACVWCTQLSASRLRL